jgi:hypothetical protein
MDHNNSVSRYSYPQRLRNFNIQINFYASRLEGSVSRFINAF